jgi:uncharacterized protein YndB with AHSA1/START domain
MPVANSPTMPPADRVLSMSRIFDAPVRIVYEAWTTPGHIQRWWGPRGFTTLSCEMDLRPGGRWRVHSRSNEGREYAEHGVFREVMPLQRLVFTHCWEGANGTPGLETLVTVTFAAQDGTTRVDFQQAVFDSVETRKGHEEGWGSAFELLAEFLAGVRSCREQSS